jgi:hypothetical protein
MDERTYLKVKIKSLAEEARIIRKETKRAKSKTIKEGLYLHRIGTVRIEARHTHLAYGFLRGREYHQIETSAHSAPDWKKVRKMIEKYGAHLANWHLDESYTSYKERCDQYKVDKEEVLKRFDEWIKAASYYYETTNTQTETTI